MANFGKKGQANLGQTGRIDSHRPVNGMEPVGVPRSPFWVHVKRWWPLYFAVATGLFAGFAALFMPELMGSRTQAGVGKALFYVVAGTGVSYAFFNMFRKVANLRKDTQSLFSMGPLFQIGAVVAAGVYLWVNGVSVLWDNSPSIDFGPKFAESNVNQVNQEFSAVTAVLQWVKFIGVAYFGGKIMTYVGKKLGLDEMFNTQAGQAGQTNQTERSK